jgi:hypothetical protein
VALNGKSTRPGVYKCRDCRQPFSVTVGTVFERSKIPLSKWLMANHMLNSGKKGVSAHEIHRTLGVTYKTAWFLMHRLREAMAPGASAGPLGGSGKTVEADETVMAKSRKTRQDKPLHAKPDVKVMSLVERGGAIRSVFLDERGVRGALVEHLHEDSRLVTDGSNSYKFQVAKHQWTTASTNGRAVMFTPTRSKDSFRSSSAAWSAPTSTATANIFTAIWQSSTFAITTARSLALMTHSAPTMR